MQPQFSPSQFGNTYDPAGMTGRATLHRFTFTGSGGEYFLIWIVNVALTILTLGLYAPWAKVRREQYFHTHTHLGGHSFNYTADPWSILKGRLLVFGVIFGSSLLGSIFPPFNILLVVLVVIGAPWVITQALRFRARYTEFRNIPFRFTGSYGQSFLYFIVARIVAYVSLLLLLPWAKHAERGYVVDSLRFGATQFSFRATLGKFYKIYLGASLLFLVPFGIFITRAIGAGLEEGNEPTEFFSALGAVGAIAMVVSAILAFVVVPLLAKVWVSRVVWNGTRIGDYETRYTISTAGYLWIIGSNLLLRVITLGLAAPFCAVRLHRYRVENLALEGPPHLDGFLAAGEKEFRAIGDEAADLYDLDIDLGF